MICVYISSRKNHKSNPSTSTDASVSKWSEKNFLPALISSIRQLLQRHFDFDECIEVVGLLCIEFDRKRKENFKVNELVKMMKTVPPRYISKSYEDSSVDEAQPQSKTTTNILQQDIKPNVSQDSSYNPNNDFVSNHSNNTREVFSEPSDSYKFYNDNLNPKVNPYVDPAFTSNSPSLTKGATALPSILPIDKQSNNQNDDCSQTKSSKTSEAYPCIKEEDTSCPEYAAHLCRQNGDTSAINNSAFSEISEPSFEIDVENTDTSQEIQDSDDRKPDDGLLLKKMQPVCEVSFPPKPLSSTIENTVSNNPSSVIEPCQSSPTEMSVQHHLSTTDSFSKNEEAHSPSISHNSNSYLDNNISSSNHEAICNGEDLRNKDGPIDMSFWRSNMQTEVKVEYCNDR